MQWIIIKTTFKRMKEERIAAVLMIQRNFREYRRVSMLPKAIKMFKSLHVKSIQKYLRGYLVFHKRVPELRQEKLGKIYVFFDNIKQGIEAKALTFLHRFSEYVTVKCKRVREEREADIAAKAKKKKGTKGKATKTNRVNAGPAARSTKSAVY